MKPFISLCMIVKNEESVLRRCLESVKEYINEIIIVDTGSEDSTRDVAREFTENIFEYEWTNNFSHARNFAASKASGDWILVLDADEYVDPTNLKTAIEEIKKNEKKFEIYAVNIINFAGEYGESIAQHKHVRIYRNNNTIEFFRSIHEQLSKKDKTPVNIGLSKLMVYHSGYLAKTMQDKDKTNRNKILINKEIQKNSNAFDLFNLGNEYRILGENELALNFYIEAFKKKADFSVEWIPFCLCNMVECLIDLNRFNEALKVIEDATEMYRNTADFVYLKGHIYLAQGRYDDAKKVFNNIILNPDIYKNVIKSPDFRDYLPYKRLGLIHEQEKDYESAIKYSIGALNNNKYCLESVTRVLRILHKFHSETETYNFVSKNILNDNKDFIRKILIFALNQGWSEFAGFLSNDCYSENELMGKLIRLKVDIIKGNCNTHIYDEKLESSFLLLGLKSAIIDLSDLFILYNNMGNHVNRTNIEVMIENSNLYSILSRINSEEQESTIIDVYGYINLLEKCVSFQKFDLLNRLIELKEKVGVSIDVKIARAFFNKGYEDEAIEFYQLANEESLEENDYTQIIDWLISKGEFQEAYRILLDCIKKYKENFKFHKYIITLLEQEGKSAGGEILNACKIFKDSEWLDHKLLSM
ncbi:glycosyl transferase [Bacillus sp. UMB0899]|nr:glycosyl transferase [Bacillus sp. UMB0899]